MQYLAKISYLGTGFCGSQVQPGKRTVQGELNRATAALFHSPCAITGCSRTDSGVHALAYYVSIVPQQPSLCARIPADRLPYAIRPYLPDDISVLAAREMPDAFHPRYSVREKEYRYEVWNAAQPSPFLRGRAWHYPRHVDARALQDMQAAAKELVGTHDFASFMAQGSHVTDTVRTVFNCTCERNGDFLRFRVRGNGFLYHMVRIMVGTLLGVAEGKYRPDGMRQILLQRDRKQAGETAPAEGLYLFDVKYNPPVFL